jgi:hypothetical protein
VEDGLRDLAALTAEDFEPAIGTSFLVAVADAEPIELVLDRVIRQGAQAGRKVGFALDFHGPSPCLGQGIQHMHHPEIGRLEIFIVPTAEVDGGFRYEAVFG